MLENVGNNIFQNGPYWGPLHIDEAFSPTEQKNWLSPTPGCYRADGRGRLWSRLEEERRCPTLCWEAHEDGTRRMWIQQLFLLSIRWGPKGCPKAVPRAAWHCPAPALRAGEGNKKAEVWERISQICVCTRINGHVPAEKIDIALKIRKMRNSLCALGWDTSSQHRLPSRNKPHLFQYLTAYSGFKLTELKNPKVLSSHKLPGIAIFIYSSSRSPKQTYSQGFPVKSHSNTNIFLLGENKAH